MTYNPNHDRDYWRSADDTQLTDAARDSGHELAIALGERLEALRGIEARLADLEHENAVLTERCERFYVELRAYEDGIFGTSDNSHGKSKDA